MGALLGSSVTPAAHADTPAVPFPVCVGVDLLIHKSSRKVCCGLCWILINVSRVNQQVTTPSKFILLLIVAAFPALCENCFLLFHLPECICGCALLTGYQKSQDFLLGSCVLPSIWFLLKLSQFTKECGNCHADWENKGPSSWAPQLDTQVMVCRHGGHFSLLFFLFPTIFCSGAFLSFYMSQHPHHWPNPQAIYVLQNLWLLPGI